MIENLKTEGVISCPHCHKEYEFEEIFYIDEFLNGNLVEEYICEMCDTPFRVEMKITYKIDKVDTNLSNKTIINF